MQAVRSSSAPESGVGVQSVGERPYYSISQAAALLGVSRVTVWRWIRAGELPVRRLGHRTVRIKREDLERLVESGTHGSRRWTVGDPRDGATARNGAALLDPTELDARDHLVQFYETDAFLRRRPLHRPGAGRG